MTTHANDLVLLLDAMGVIYSVGDDVAELLIPFIQEKHGCTDIGGIEENYMAASLGQMDADTFWEAVGLDSGVEEEYLERLTLTPELESFLDLAQARTRSIACLSNDVSRWSDKLRKKFGLERWISNWIISGDVQVRKPSPIIYQRCLDQLEVEPQKVLFVDDRVKNLDPAAEIGFSTVLFDPTGTVPTSGHPAVRRLAQIVDFLTV